MTSQQIEAFLAIVAHGSFNKAAQSLFLTQPAITHRISQLERELDVTLFNRSGFTLCNPLLTDAGRVFLEKAHAYQELYKSTQAALAVFRPNSEFALGFTQYMLDGNSEVFLMIMQQISSDLSITIKPRLLDKPARQKAQLLSGEIDLLFSDLTVPVWQSAAFEKARLFDCPIYACLHREHPLAHEKNLTFAALEQEVLCCVEDNTFFADLIREKLPSPNYQWMDARYGSLAEALSILTPQRGILLTNTKSSIVQNIVYLPIQHDLFMPVGIVWMKERATPLLRQLVKAICDLPQSSWRL